MKTNLLKTAAILTLLFLTGTVFSQITINETITDCYCNGDASGEIQITVSGGVSPYTYNWDGPSGSFTTQNINGLVAGTYNVTVTDNNLDTQVGSYSVGEPDAITIIESKTDVSCNGGTDGTINLTVIGGNGTYTYNWSNGEVDEDIFNIGAGTYTVTVSDGNGCQGIQTYSINEPTALVITGTQTNISCNGGADGSVDITASGGDPGYTFSWSGPNGFTSVYEDITGMQVGTYIVEVTDQNGCQENYTVDITEPNAMVINATQNDAHCGNADGSIDLSVTGATPPYTYNWSDGVTTTSNINGLVAGTYIVTVTDANGCVLDSTYAINDLSAPTITMNATNPTCFGSFDGAIDVNAPTATSFIWSNGANTEDISDLPAGWYIVSVTDANGCMANDSALLVEPSTITINTDSIINTTGTCNGYVGVSANGGVSPYTYIWNTGSTTYYISDICFGEFYLTVTDANGCTQTGTYLVGSAYTDTTTFVDTVQTSVDTCLFDNASPIDSAYIYDFQTITIDSALLNWVFWQDGDSLLLDIGINIETQGNNLVYLELICNNKAVTIQNFYGMFNAITTQVERINLLSNIRIYPNPSNGFITIQTNEVNDIEIINISGKVIYKHNNISDNQEIDISNQPKGIYLVKVSTTSGVVVKKIIIE